MSATQLPTFVSRERTAANRASSGTAVCAMTFFIAARVLAAYLRVHPPVHTCVTEYHSRRARRWSTVRTHRTYVQYVCTVCMYLRQQPVQHKTKAFYSLLHKRFHARVGTTRQVWVVTAYGMAVDCDDHGAQVLRTRSDARVRLLKRHGVVVHSTQWVGERQWRDQLQCWGAGSTRRRRWRWLDLNAREVSKVAAAFDKPAVVRFHLLAVVKMVVTTEEQVNDVTT